MQVLKLILVTLAVMGIDRLSKDWAVDQGLVVLNTGVSFSMMEQATPFLLTMFLIQLMFLVAIAFRGVWFRYQLIAGLFFGGALSNTLDRLLYGGVQDWFFLPGVNLTINFADSCITGAVILVFWVAFTEQWRQARVL